MEHSLAYLLLGAGWPLLIIGSVWALRQTVRLSDPAETLLKVSLVSFYTLAYACTAYWIGESWLIGGFPAFLVLLVLLAIVIRALIIWRDSAF
jgi:hypothetical protein